MGKITFVKIAGKNYPMSFSLGATKKLIAKFGSVEKMKKKLGNAGEEEEKLETVVEILELLIAQGCAYKNYFEKDIPAPGDAPIVNGKWEPLPKEVIEIAMDIFDMEEVVKKIGECINGGSEKKVEGIEDKKVEEPLRG